MAHKVGNLMGCMIHQLCYTARSMGSGGVNFFMIHRRWNHIYTPNSCFGFTGMNAPKTEIPHLPPPSSASMELMAVPKKKVSPYKKGLRNGPKALKPIPVIIRCKSCGRVKLPHFYCCSGD